MEEEGEEEEKGKEEEEEEEEELGKIRNDTPVGTALVHISIHAGLV